MVTQPISDTQPAANPAHFRPLPPMQVLPMTLKGRLPHWPPTPSVKQTTPGYLHAPGALQSIWWDLSLGFPVSTQLNAACTRTHACSDRQLIQQACVAMVTTAAHSAMLLPCSHAALLPDFHASMLPCCLAIMPCSQISAGA